jgi:hypothetical protein
MSTPLEVFCCYARKDQEYLREIKKYLMSLQRENLIEIRADIDITPGKEWEREINRHLEKAQIVLLLVSSDFIASNYCYEKEMQQALARHEQGTARVVPVIVRPCDWGNLPISKLQALPDNAKPIWAWKSKGDAYLTIVKGIRLVIQELAYELDQKSYAFHAFNLAVFSIFLNAAKFFARITNPSVIQDYKDQTQAQAEALGVAIDVNELEQSAQLGAADLLTPIIDTLMESYSERVVLCFRLGLLLTSYFVTHGGYPLSKHDKEYRYQIEQMEQSMQHFASSVGIDKRELEPLISACKNIKNDKSQQQQLQKIDKIGRDVLAQIATYLYPNNG